MAEYIDREAALHEIERREALMVGDKRVSVASIKSFIKNRPAADVAPVVHGRWEWLGPYRYNDDGMIGTCSVCKERLRLFAYNYCPNCGCRMDGGDDE